MRADDRHPRSVVEHVALTLPQQQRLDELREHRPVTVNDGPGGTIEATVTLSRGEQHIFRAGPDKLLDRVEEVIGQQEALDDTS